MEIVDWTGNTINEGDTVIYTSGIEGNGINYGVVEKIDTQTYPGNRTLRRVRVRSLLKGTAQTIIEDRHYVAYNSITKFDAGNNWRKPKWYR